MYMDERSVFWCRFLGAGICRNHFTNTAICSIFFHQCKIKCILGSRPNVLPYTELHYPASCRCTENHAWWIGRTEAARETTYFHKKWLDFSAIVAIYAVLPSPGWLKTLVIAIATINVHSPVPELMARPWYDHAPVSISKKLLDR